MLTPKQLDMKLDCIFLNEATIKYTGEVNANKFKDKKILDKIISGTKAVYGVDLTDEEIEDMKTGSDRNYIVSRSGDDGTEALQNVNFKTLNNKKMELLLESKNLVEDFNNFMYGEFDKIVDHYSDENNLNKTSTPTPYGVSIEKSYARDLSLFTEGIISSLNYLYQMGVEKNDAYQYLLKEYIIDSDDPEVIKKLIKLRVQYNKSMTLIFETMLRANYKFLGLNEKEIEALIGGLSSGDDNKEKEIMSRIKKIVRDKSDEFVDNENGLIDFRKIGGGIILGPADFAGLDEAKNTPERYLQHAFTYDVVIISHGIQNELNHEDRSDDDETQIGWTIQPTTFNGNTYEKISDLLRALIKAGYKNIKINSCNPGHYTLPKDIINGHSGVTINMPKNSIIREDGEFELDPTMYYITETENSLYKLANDYGIDYDDNQMLYEMYSEPIENTDYFLSESKVWDTIKELVKKFVAAIVFIWKKIVEFFKLVWNKLKEFVGKHKGSSKKTKKPIKVNCIVTSGNKSGIKETNVTSSEELGRYIGNACSTISANIRRENSKQDRVVRQYTAKLNQIIKEKENAVRNG